MQHLQEMSSWGRDANWYYGNNFALGLRRSGRPIYNDRLQTLYVYWLAPKKETTMKVINNKRFPYPKGTRIWTLYPVSKGPRKYRCYNINAITIKGWSRCPKICLAPKEANCLTGLQGAITLWGNLCLDHKADNRQLYATEPMLKDLIDRQEVENISLETRIYSSGWRQRRGYKRIPQVWNKYTKCRGGVK
jgi:hypothetical protein